MDFTVSKLNCRKQRVNIFFFIVVFLLSIAPVSAQFSWIQQLKDDDKTDLSLYFYPSTLRMMNLEKDTAFNRLIKGVEKLSFHQLKVDSFNVASFQGLKESIQQQENFEDYLTMEGGSTVGSGFQIIGNEEGDEWVGMGFIDGQGYLIALKGAINWLQLPKVYRSILEKGEESNTGFGILLKYLQTEEDRRKARQEWQKKRKEENPDSTKKESVTITING